MRLLFVGYRFFPYRHPGDKTFWLELVRGMADRGVEADVLSVDVRPPVVPSDFPVKIRFVPAVPVRMRDPLFQGRYNTDAVEIERITNYGSKTLTLPRLAREIRQRVRQDGYDGVHLMDNLGPASPLLRALVRAVPCALSAVAYNPRGFLYDSMLWLSYAGAAQVVAFSDAFATQLAHIGVSPRLIRTIRWGVNVHGFSGRSRTEAEKGLGLDSHSLLVAWAGFVQQTTLRDFEMALRIARDVRARMGERVTFWFCFKPAHFQAGFSRFQEPGIRVTGDSTVFHRVRDRADALLAPISDPGTILAPPLTWIEFLASGAPIFTLQTVGVDEAIEPGVGGFAEPNESQLGLRLQAVLEDPPSLNKLSLGARVLAGERFDLRRCVDEYVGLWSDLVSTG